MRLADEYEWVPQLRHYQALFARYRHAPATIKTLEQRFGLRRVADSDPAPYSAESALLMSEWLHAEGDSHAMAWIAHAIDLSAGDGSVYFLRAHATLALALAELSRLSPLFFPDAHFSWEVVGDSLYVAFAPLGSYKRLGVLLRYEAICVWMVRVLDDITAGKAQPVRIEWMRTEQLDATTLQQILPVMPDIGAAQFTLVYPAGTLQLHLPGASDTLRRHLQTLFEKRISGSQHSSTTTRRVAQWLSDRQELQEPRLAAAAKALSMGASTLRRRLAQESSSFSDILASYRANVAVHFLVHGDKGADEVAQLTGYADRNAFERAFRDWFGITPAHCQRAVEQLMGKRRHLDWASPSKWARHAETFEGLRKQIDHASPDLPAMAQAIESDPVLHARVLGFMAMPSLGAKAWTQITADNLARLPGPSLGYLLSAATPLADSSAQIRCLAVWEAGRRAVAAVEVLGSAMGCGDLGPLRLAAACYNLGHLVLPSDAERHVDGVDLAWLLLASWHVPPVVLQLLRDRHAPQHAAPTALALAISWAEGSRYLHDSPGYIDLEDCILLHCPAATLEKLRTLNS